MDVTTASLHPEIGQPNVLMNLPELRGLANPLKFSIRSLASSGTAGATLRLRKVLQGLKQAPRLRYQEIESFSKV